MNVFEEAPFYKDGQSINSHPFVGQEESYHSGLAGWGFNYQEHSSIETPASFTNAQQLAGSFV